MLKRAPQVISTQYQADQIILTMWIDPELADFQGHFAGYPLLPGVTQIGWAQVFGKEFWQPRVFAGMENVKFQQPVRPGDTVVLTLNWASDTSKLSFWYASAPDIEGKSVIHTSGRIRFLPA
ncbi:3-hydroxyacyl-ACP dehydratase FabZ family protein [Photobacterium sp. TY1-4]|uniref:3-hydroxyacyl-ACP dehydratase FabZ family protein n=1 Tax=Photobacterium sp. TY1-4 TaxID=2899122 RepID=UPI0021C17804|nr:3-hydroxyacyl-ACP dehydratase [Photobacterium sp. TY1-4]UXI03739.1 3-hydroxyacyl-ACP dehydratase [Photobacterium sp. TY1-4]